MKKLRTMYAKLMQAVMMSIDTKALSRDTALDMCKAYVRKAR